MSRRNRMEIKPGAADRLTFRVHPVRRTPWIVLTLIVAATGTAGVLLYPQAKSMWLSLHPSQEKMVTTANGSLLEQTLSLPNSAASRRMSPSNSSTMPDSADGHWKAVVVKSGDTLSALFRQARLNPRTVRALVSPKSPSATALARLYPGEVIKLLIGPEGRLLALRYPVSATETMQLNRDGSGFHAATVNDAIAIEARHTYGVVKTTFLAAAKQAGLSNRLTAQLAHIFGWEIDFTHGIRVGDHFSVVYQTYLKNGRKVRNGNIVAAEFECGGRTYRAVRYTDPSGHTAYYSPAGQSMRKAFLRSPVGFRHVGIRVPRERYRPVLRTDYVTKGIDYAVAAGTPVEATGAGTIAFRGWKGGYGRVVILRHADNISTLYAHLSTFAKGLQAGDSVRQGQLIGRVGMSGLATAPHLHYEFRVDGAPRNPATVRLPNGKRIPAKYRTDFAEQTTPLLAQLDVINRNVVARNDTP